MGADDEHRIQCMAFEILRRFIAHPSDFEATERAKDPLVLGQLVLALKSLPALNRMQPFTDIQLAQAACLARLLADYGRIPEGRRFSVRRLANCGGRRRLTPGRVCGASNGGADCRRGVFFLNHQSTTYARGRAGLTQT